MAQRPTRLERERNCLRLLQEIRDDLAESEWSEEKVKAIEQINEVLTDLPD